MAVFLSVLFGLTEDSSIQQVMVSLCIAATRKCPMSKSALVEIDTTGNGCAGNAVFLLGFYWLQSVLNKYKPFIRIFSLQITKYMIL